MFLEQLLHLSSLFFTAFPMGKPGDLFPELCRDRRAGATRNFAGVTIEELQQGFEIIIHGKRVVKEKRESGHG
jgi:hypothetical protein